jgi:hypothetical protein
MSVVELQIPPKVLLEIFEAKSVGTGMTHSVPGGATLTVKGLEQRHHDALPLVPVTITLGPGVAIDLLASWLYERLKHANVRHIRIQGVEIEVTMEVISKAIAESIDSQP